ncbi:DUF3592 domain-containing protein [Lactococcus termiticola]|uniref:DUF3592 domain-containing protein n=1 Tax=Lactococcus termiticola TaxID=2169526 RepID=A0A2R5HK36_9LACT|nr:DUF3592 domain-containing protein [Lactococcus termiticola]GBG97110.1 hypothetical protein NtB2_01247 [Lactococcus termiticola]
MKKTVKIIQVIIRLVMLIVGIGLLASSIFLTGVHIANKNLEKSPTQGLIVRGDDIRSVHEVRYSFEGKNYERRPLDAYFRSLGQEGEKLTVYVANKYPERVFLSRTADGLLSTAGFMAGWGILLLVILLGEHQLMSRIKLLEEKTGKEEEGR